MKITFDDLSAAVRSAFHPLRIHRMKKGYTLRELSALSGVTWMGIHFIEIQKYGNIKPETIFKLAVALKLNPATLYVKCLEYQMERVPTESRKALRVVAKKGEGPKEMLARLLHRQLHPLNVYLSKTNKSADDFIEAVSISSATLKNWLDNKSLPNTKLLKRVADELGFNIDDLINDIDRWAKEDRSDPVSYIQKNVHRLED